MRLQMPGRQAKARSPSATAKRVLIVDDVPEMCEALRSLFESLRLEDLEIDTATDGFRAVEMLGRKPYDLVLSDTRIPYIDGFKVLAAAKVAHPDGLRLLMTAYDSLPGSFEERQGAALDGFIRKPFRALELRHLLIGLLQATPETVEAWRAGRRKPILCRPEDAPPETRDLL